MFWRQGYFPTWFRLPSSSFNRISNLPYFRTLDVRENSLRDLNLEPIPETLEKLTLIGKYNRSRENIFSCINCAKVESFGQLMVQLNTTNNARLKCIIANQDKVDVFHDAGESGMALNSILTVQDHITYRASRLQ